jgi:ABC-type dipeptide/oligopeptide/nickel transport system permease subunit
MTASVEPRPRVDIRGLSGNRLAAVSTFVVIGFLLLALLAPWVAPHDPYKADLYRRLQPPAWQENGQWSYPLGCDALGRDVLSRIIYGSRVSIAVGLSVILVSTTVGLVAGLAAGYLRGKVDVVISWIVNILLGFPYLIFAIGLMAMTGPGFQNIILALAYKEWIIPCRVARGETLVARESEYVEAARALGASGMRVMFREILPNITSPVLVVAAMRLAYVIILEASLSFLGLGVQPPTPSWGSLVADGRVYIFEAWWVSTFPGLAILLMVMAVNIAGQSFREALDPLSRQ